MKLTTAKWVGGFVIGTVFGLLIPYFVIGLQSLSVTINHRVEAEEVVEVWSPSETSKTIDHEALEAFLVQRGADELAEHTEAIVELNRWEEVIAITAKETSYCTAGVGASKNNCGAIMSRRPDRIWKIYENVLDSVEDIAILLDKPLYKGKSIDEINGTYCVGADGGKCPNWTETVEKTAETLRSLVYAKN